MGKIDALPQTLTVQGKAYPIKTGFRSWIAFEAILSRNDLTIEEKQVFALRRVLKSPAPPGPFFVFGAVFAGGVVLPLRTAQRPERGRKAGARPEKGFLGGLG